MLQIDGKIEDRKYYQLIDYLYQKCDVLTFGLYNHYQYYVTPKNIHCFPQYDLNSHVNEEDCNEFIEYKKRIEWLIAHYRRFFIKEYTDVEYAGGLCGHKIEIKIIRFDEYLLGALKGTQGLYDWRAPNKPENLCFYSGTKCFLQSIAHEKLCFYIPTTKKLRTR